MRKNAEEYDRLNVHTEGYHSTNIPNHPDHPVNLPETRSFSKQMRYTRVPNTNTLVPGSDLTVIVYTGPFEGWDSPEVNGLPSDNEKRSYISHTNGEPLFLLRLAVHAECSILVRQLPVQSVLFTHGLVEAQIRGLLHTLCAAHQARQDHGWDFLWRHVQDHLPHAESEAFQRIGASMVRLMHSLHTRMVPYSQKGSVESPTSPTSPTYAVTTIFTSDPGMFLTQRGDRGRFPFVYGLQRVPDVLDGVDQVSIENTVTGIRTCTTVVKPNHQLMDGCLAFALSAGST